MLFITRRLPTSNTMKQISSHQQGLYRRNSSECLIMYSTETCVYSFLLGTQSYGKVKCINQHEINVTEQL